MSRLPPHLYAAPPAAYSPLPAATDPPASSPKPEKAEIMAMRIQLELKTRGFCAGPVDGQMSQDVRNSIGAFQIVHGISETGTMDNLTLPRLGIVY